MRKLLFVVGIGLLAPYWLGDTSIFVLPSFCVAVLLSYWRSLQWVAVLVIAFSYSSYQVQSQVQQQLRDCPHKLQVGALLRVEEVLPGSAHTTRIVV